MDSGVLETGANDVGGSTLTITGMLTNNSGGTFEMLGAGDKGSIGNGMSNAGLVDVDNGITLKITGNVNNSGTVETSSYYGTGNNTITITGGLTNSGNFFLRAGGDVANVGSLANTANIQIGSGASLNIAGSTDTNSGTVTLYGGTLSSPSAAGNFDNTGTVQTNSGSAASTITIGGTFTNEVGANLALNNSGDVAMIATLANGGTVNVASGALLGLGKGMFAAGGGFQQLANGTLNEIIGSTASFGVLNITGPVSLAGLLNITLLNGFNPTNDSFTFVNFTGSLTGGFSNGPKFTEDGYSWTITYGANDIILTAGAIAQNYTATWSNGSGNWTDNTRWTCNPSLSPCVPNNNSSFVFNVVTNSPGQTLTLDSSSNPTSITINSLSLVAGTLNIGTGASLNLVNQPGGITDIPSGAGLEVSGTFTTGGSTSALAGLTSVEGILNLYGQSFTDTPGSGTLTIASNAYLLANYNPTTATGTNLTISGNVSNSGVLATGYYGSGANTLTITGNLTNNGDFYLENAGDLAKVATFTNNGETYVYTGATLNLTSQANGITDAVAGSRFDLAGTFTAGGANGFANLNSVEGIVSLYGQSFTDTPGSGTLTIGSNGYLLANYNPTTATGTNLTISGNVSNSGVLATGYYGSGASTLTITGNLTNNGDFYLENAGDLAKVATFTNNGETYVYTGATLNLTSQANGITDAVAGSRFDLAGTFTAGGANGFANLNSVEGIVSLYGQSFTDTPGSGTLTIGSNGYLLANYNPSTATGTNLTISANVSNSGVLATGYYGSGASTLTITGNLTNNGDFYLENAGDLAKVPTFTNNGETYVYTGATLNLTSQANGITDAVAGSRFDLAGTFTAGGNNGFAKLNSVEGIVSLYGQTLTDTPGSGTLTISNNGYYLANYNPHTATGTNLTIAGNVSNSGVLATGYYGSGASTLAITGESDQQWRLLSGERRRCGQCRGRAGQQRDYLTQLGRNSECHGLADQRGFRAAQCDRWPGHRGRRPHQLRYG